MAELAEATEAVAEVAEEVAEQAINVAEASRGLDPQQLRLLLVGLGGGLIGGFVVGGLYINRRLRTSYEKLAEEEISEMREHFRARLLAKEEKPDLSSEAAKIVKREGYDGPATPVIEEEEDGVQAGGTSSEEDEETVVVEEVEVEEEGEASETSVNVFDEQKTHADDDWDYEEEVRLRRPDRPYVIHYDEQHDPDKPYTEQTLVYYAGDDVLCDERDTPIDDKEKVVGEGNLEKFGHGSHDKNVVYIRNDVMQIDVEIVKNDGSYAEVVHGFVQHSDELDRRRRSHRFDDEPGPA